MKSHFKIIIITAVLFSAYHHGFAQWVGPGTTGSGNIYIENSKVGIGVTDPKETLHINGPIRGNQSGALRIRSNYGYVDIGSKNTNWAHFQTDRAKIFLQRRVALGEGILASHDTRNLIFNTGMKSSTNGDTRMTILNTNGHIGMGTTSPRYPLDVRTSDDFEGNNFYVGNRRLYLAGVTGTGSQMYGGLVLTNLGEGGRSLDIVVGNNNFDNALTPENKIMSVLSSGKVGIGTTNPEAKLQVKQSNDNGFRLERDGHDLYELRLQGNTGLQILNKTDSRREMTFDGNGNIGIGTMDPDYKLEVEKTHNAINNVEYLLGAFNHSGNAGGVYMGYVGDGADAKEAVVRSGGNINLNLGTTTHRHALTISNSTGAIGIGTKEPAEPLHVQGTATIVADIGSPTEPHYKVGSHTLELQNHDAGDVILAMHRSGHSVANIKYNSSRQLVLSSSGSATEKHLIIDQYGKVSIGEATSDQQLTVDGSINVGGDENAHIRVRHVNGKSQSSTDYGNLYLNYGNNYPVFVGSSSNQADLYVYGKVGIGTNNPTEAIDVIGNVKATAFLNSAGESIINTLWKGASNDTDLIHRDGSIILGGNSVMGNYDASWKYFEMQDDGIFTIGKSVNDRLQLMHSTNWGTSLSSSSKMIMSAQEKLSFQTNGDWQKDKMTITQEGNVGIGTDSPTNKLEVDGIIRSREVLVQASPWPDYVFAPEYNLLSLEETAKYIEENQHLPGIPSAEEVAANGVAVGDMNAKLLEKIEELTLHLIKQSSEIEAMQEQIKDLTKTNKELLNHTSNN